MKVHLTACNAPIVVDVQNDFLPGGSLAAPQGDWVIPVFIQPVICSGKRVNALVPLAELCKQTLAGYARLPEAMKGIAAAPPYPVDISDALQKLAKTIDSPRDGS